MRATISDMGPLLLGRLLGLNETQRGVLTLVFKIADDDGLLLLDLKDLRAMLQFVGENAKRIHAPNTATSRRRRSARSSAALLALEEQGADRFFGEPMLDIEDLIQTGGDGRGVVNILAADKLMNAPKLYATFLLWMLSELFERLPEVGDPEKPKLVFFFDEAHLLFDDAPDALVEKIEQVVRLIRSKGVGVYFVTQNPLDIPDTVLGAARQPRAARAARVHAARSESGANGGADAAAAIPRSTPNRRSPNSPLARRWSRSSTRRARPAIVERAGFCRRHRGSVRSRPRSAARVIGASVLKGHYEQPVDRESAYEKLRARAEERTAGGLPKARHGAPGEVGASPRAPAPAAAPAAALTDILFGRSAHAAAGAKA